MQISLASHVHRVLEHVVVPPVDRVAPLSDSTLEIVLFVASSHPATDVRVTSFDWIKLQNVVRPLYLLGRNTLTFSLSRPILAPRIALPRPEAGV